MKIMETRTETLAREVQVGVECDMCKQRFREHDGSYHSKEVRISARDITSYPECGSSEDYEPDVCWDCFINRIIPALKALGLDIKWDSRDW